MRKYFSHLSPSVLVYAVLFLFFLQLLADFIAAIYAFGLLGSSLPMELAAVVVFLAPFLLLVVKRGLSTGALTVLAYLVLFSRAVETVLPTRFQLLVAGIGVGLSLFLFPALLWHRGQRRDTAAGPITAAGLVLAVATSYLLRTLGSTMDLSNEGGFRIITVLLAIGATVLLPRVLRQAPRRTDASQSTEPTAGDGKVIGLSLGLAAVFLLFYFAFASPAVITPWTRSNYLLILTVATVALVLFGGLLAFGRQLLARISRTGALILTSVFVLALTLTLAVNQVAMPGEAAGYPLADPGAGALGLLSLLVMLLLFPVLFLDFSLLVEEAVLVRPAIRQLGLGFGLASLFMLVMILANIFTAVWSYIDPVLEPLFRYHFWQIHFIVGLVLVLSLWAVSNKAIEEGAYAADRRIDRAYAGLVAIAGLLTLVAAILFSPQPPSSPPTGRLKVAGYNVRQGYDRAGQRSHAAQCAVLKDINADIIGLSETDTARVAGANFDIVHYLAKCLDMHAYGGARTGAGTFGYALLSRYPIENPETHHLFSGPGFPASDDPERTSDGDQVAVVKAQINVAGITYHVFVNHFDSHPPFEQPQGFASLASGLENVIAIGDFNCQPGERCFEIMTESLVHCAATGEDPAAADGKIDHIFVSPELQCPVYGYVNSEASDHPAVVAEIVARQ